jgi:hypothetical protein
MMDKIPYLGSYFAYRLVYNSPIHLNVEPNAFLELLSAKRVPYGHASW